MMPGSYDASILLGKEQPVSNGCRGKQELTKVKKIPNLQAMTVGQTRGEEIPRDPELITRTGDSQHADWENNTNLIAS